MLIATKMNFRTLKNRNLDYSKMLAMEVNEAYQ